MSDNNIKRDSWNSKLGFIITCIGSAVGMGNLWLFPSRIANYGGTFLLLYVFFTVIVGYTGLIGELALGRRTKGGPIDAFSKACETHNCSKFGMMLGIIPVISSVMLASGYAVVCSWILKYTLDYICSIFSHNEIKDLLIYESKFGNISQNNFLYILVTMLICLFILARSISNGIENTNKVMIPVFFCLMIFLIGYIAVQPNAYKAYQYIFSVDVNKLKDPMIWAYALGQSFFSLSLAGNGTIIYGSYLKDDIDILSTSKKVVFFDTLSSIFATLMIVPAMAINGETKFSGGPGLMFIHLPNVFSKILHGNIVAMIFFFAALFAGLTSLINLFETSIATVQDNLKLSRAKSSIIIISFCLAISMLIQKVVGEWMNFISIYLCPTGALLAAVMFAWIWGKNAVEDEISKNHRGNIIWYYPTYKYVFCGIVFFIVLLGIFKGSIG